MKELILFDNGETPMHNLRLELEERYPKLHFEPVIGDIRIEAAPGLQRSGPTVRRWYFTLRPTSMFR